MLAISVCRHLAYLYFVVSIRADKTDCGHNHLATTNPSVTYASFQSFGLCSFPLSSFKKRTTD